MKLKEIFIVIKKNQKGFTLVELIVALAIIALIMGGDVFCFHCCD